jgi:hypothetical protein
VSAEGLVEETLDVVGAEGIAAAAAVLLSYGRRDAVEKTLVVVVKIVLVEVMETVDVAVAVVVGL